MNSISLHFWKKYHITSSYIEQFHVELKEVGMKTLITEENLCKLYKSMEPTAKNILNILSCIETNFDEIKTFGFFKK